MAKYKFIFTLIIALSCWYKSNSQVIQSDTGYLWNNDKSSLKVFSFPFKGDYFLYKGQDGAERNYIKKTDTLIHFHDSIANPYGYSYQPTGKLKLNDSTFFIVGSLGTFMDEGIILKSIDSGKNWSVQVFKKYFYSAIKSKSLYFFNDKVGVILFKASTYVGENESYYLAFTHDQGETWEFKKIKDPQAISFTSTIIEIKGKVDTSNRYQPILKGSFKLKNMGNWESIQE